MYDFENMDQRLIAYVNIFICANRLQAIMDSGFEDITAKQWLAITMIDAFPEPPTLKQISELSGSHIRVCGRSLTGLSTRAF